MGSGVVKNSVACFDCQQIEYNLQHISILPHCVDVYQSAR